ncbi:DUF1993 domain-containing protein [Altererythrobacter sp.]|uniref:DUF1993 domain-containing protein n=1 Tax=Altererythrobacter sp. TaxID=1872480 RepID=UPI001B0A6A27|nr:DUF1993 domain-containing protein [Altererythrobacter sp.]MBO6610048.1 DUF1993 domain-containing protein [Altererythrobacter sp.]MBO6642674.1 DUF1993 domain-containing protein [Altererythrobacter sp.]MBO6708818.1 DUF1993 domain-containing protein [Altererythrobacter sp.]MBO6945074.1 DUF1993 domain-containing protein [Altererythrobacter sp.]
MAITLYDAFVPSCQQILGGLSGLIDKGEAHVKEHGLDDTDLIEATLSDTMWTLPWHVRACWVHGAYTFDQLPTGEFTPDFTDVPDSWDSMRAMVDDTQAKLAALDPDAVEALADKTIGFVLGGKRLMEFSGQDFLLSFNQPNFYFHATTFYDILRHKGVALGKRDFMGTPRLRT